jgi:hypothetical protein
MGVDVDRWTYAMDGSLEVVRTGWSEGPGCKDV